MDLAVIIGVVVAFASIFTAAFMEGGSPFVIFVLPPMLLVFGGTIGAAIAGGTLKDAKSIIGLLKKAFTAKVNPPDEAVATLVSLAERARKEGLLALEDAVKDVNDPFLKQGLGLAIDGTDPDEVRGILESQVDAKKAVDKAGAKIFGDMGGYSPTIGIIGTVFGLVHVLENLSKPEQLGHLIAGAFIATLWGVMSANVLFLPLAARLKRISELEVGHMEVVIEGVAAIQAGANPRVVAQRLSSLLPPKPPEAAKKAA
ncbi:MAG: motA [Mycobacterium sp.]|jgi:chemotaxis protein MotA|nr:motA [Mycobacterium sp.]